MIMPQGQNMQLYEYFVKLFLMVICLLLLLQKNKFYILSIQHKNYSPVYLSVHFYTANGKIKDTGLTIAGIHHILSTLNVFMHVILTWQYNYQIQALCATLLKYTLKFVSVRLLSLSIFKNFQLCIIKTALGKTSLCKRLLCQIQ